MGNTKSKDDGAGGGEAFSHDGKDFTRMFVAKKFELDKDSSQEESSSPVMMPILRGRLDPELLSRFQALPLFKTDVGCSDTRKQQEEEDQEEDEEEERDEVLTSLGFRRCKDPGHPRDHIYYEGYFHGKGCPEPVKSLNPRFGSDHMKPAAPIEFQAFLVALRQVNAEALKKLLQETGFDCVVPEDCMFCDIAVQSHHGAGVQISQHSFVGWHFDAPNSLLHMAVSLHGTRVLHFRGNGKSHQAPMEAGDVYVTSPYSFEHAVEYPSCPWHNRVLAAQVRILFDEERYEQLVVAKKEKGLSLPNATRVVADLLLQLEKDATCFRLPTVAEVDEAFQTLAVSKSAEN